MSIAEETFSKYKLKLGQTLVQFREVEKATRKKDLEEFIDEIKSIILDIKYHKLTKEDNDGKLRTLTMFLENYKEQLAELEGEK